GRIFLRHGRHVLDAAIEAGKHVEVPVRTMIRLGRNIGETIMNTARERRANLMLLGWPGYTHSRDVAFGSVIDLISKNPPCHMAVVRFRRPWAAPQRLLLPCRGRGANVRLAFALARDIISFYAQPQHGGHAVEVCALHVITPGQPAEEVDHFRRQISHLAEELGIRVARAGAGG
ncbi:MAG: universal stress protein, partial [Ardenticatenia bacterium]|nr:universal stress protein [Ardenticatenia bacterium]